MPAAPRGSITSFRTISRKTGATCARSNRSPRTQNNDAWCSIAHYAALAKFPWRSSDRSEMPVSGSIRKSKFRPSWTSPTQTISCILRVQGGRPTYNVDEMGGETIRRTAAAMFKLRPRIFPPVLTLVLADSELELVPASIAGHPAIRTSARKRGRSPTSILVDSSLHHPALKGVPEGERRGRPDLVHGFVLLCLDSIVNQEGRLTTIVHTRHDDVLRFAPQTRIPRHYARFVGLIEELFAKGRVPSDDPLITLERGVDLRTVLASCEGRSWAFAEGGDPTDLRTAIPRLKGDLTAVIGGFPHGTFRSPVADLCDRVVSLHAAPLKAWTVAAEILVAYRLFSKPPTPTNG